MFDNLYQSPLLVFSNILLILYLYYLLKPSMQPPYSVKNRTYYWSLLLNLIFCLFSFWGLDWFGYLMSFNEIKQGYETNMEFVYVYIITNICGNYLTFRIIVWGLALLFLYGIMRRLSIKEHLFLYIFSVFFLIFFSYARVSLAMSIMFYAVSLFYKPYKKVRYLSYIIAFLLIAISYYLHKSALWGLSIILIAYLSLAIIRKRYFLFLLFLLPALLWLLQDTLSDFMIMSFSDDTFLDDALNVGQGYLQHSKKAHGIGGVISLIIESAPYYLLMYICIKLDYAKRYSIIPVDIKFFSRLLVFMVIGSAMFLLDFGYNTEVVYVRFLRFCTIPSAVMLTFLHQIQFMPKTVKCNFVLFGINVIYALSYTFYNVCLVNA